MRRSKLAIVLLLMLAIPFQGFAAAAMQSGCALGHHRPNDAAAESHKQVERHDHAAMLAAATQAAATQHDMGDSAGATIECKCGACGLGTALPVSKMDPEPGLPYAAPLGRFTDRPIIMITGGPERPPRTLLA